MNTLKNQAVQTTLAKLHQQAKGDWKSMLRYTPSIIFGLVRGKSMMKAITPSMAKNAYMPVSAESGRFLYNIARATGAKHMVEFGTSFGIGTIYLAAAAKDNGGHVVTTEIEPHKCQVASDNFQQSGLADCICLLEGNALQTLQGVEPDIDLVFMDGWKDLYNDVLDLLIPKLRTGAVVIADNVTLAEARDYYKRVSAENSGFVTSLIDKDTAMSCYVGK